MDFLFVFPAKVVFTERNINHRVIQHRLNTIAVFENRNVFFDTKNEKIKIEKSEVNSYFIEIPAADRFIYLAQCKNDEEMLARLDRMPQQEIENYFTRIGSIINNPKEYEEEAARKIEARQKEREQQELDKLEAEKKLVQTHEKELENYKEKFFVGEYIPYKYFEELCDKSNVKIPIKTKGWARKNVENVMPHNYTTKDGRLSSALLKSTRELKNKYEHTTYRCSGKTCARV